MKNSTSITPSQPGAQKNHQPADPALNLAAGTLQLARVAPTFYQMVVSPILKTLGYDPKAAKNAEERKAKKEANREKIIALAKERDAAKAAEAKVVEALKPTTPASVAEHIPAPQASSSFIFPPSEETIARIRTSVMRKLIDDFHRPLHTSPWAKEDPQLIKNIQDAFIALTESELGFSLLTKFLRVGKNILIYEEQNREDGQAHYSEFMNNRFGQLVANKNIGISKSYASQLTPRVLLHELTHFRQLLSAIADKVGGCNVPEERHVPLLLEVTNAPHYNTRLEAATTECEKTFLEYDPIEMKYPWVKKAELNIPKARALCAQNADFYTNAEEKIEFCKSTPNTELLQRRLGTESEQIYRFRLSAYPEDAIPMEKLAHLVDTIPDLKKVCPNVYNILMEDVCQKRGI
ncbi:MAG: hypothetical protein K0R63_999 [Rickettsiales bacterium]|jgi:hypothetical protein|nr:hypothetical protein [Rickettsiales bacterium]